MLSANDSSVLSFNRSGKKICRVISAPFKAPAMWQVVKAVSATNKQNGETSPRGREEVVFMKLGTTQTGGRLMRCAAHRDHGFCHTDKMLHPPPPKATTGRKAFPPCDSGRVVLAPPNANQAVLPYVKNNEAFPRPCFYREGIHRALRISGIYENAPPLRPQHAALWHRGKKKTFQHLFPDGELAI